MDIYTQYVYEKKWQKTTQKDLLRIIAQEMPQTDPESTLVYITAQLKKGKVVTLGECRFGAQPQIG